MIDIGIQDHLKAIAEWANQDEENRGCFLFVTENAHNADGAFVDASIVGRAWLQSLSEFMAEEKHILVIMSMLCTAAKLISEGND